MSLLLNKIFNSVALGHMVVDLLNGTRNVLLAFLSKPLGINNTALGLISTIYAVVASVAQPLFGYLADRFGYRWVAAGGMLWMAVFFILAVTIPGPISVILLIIASIGSGAFHPAGAVQATLAGRTQITGRETSTTSIFFLFGQTGWFMGPLLGGAVIDWLGPPGLVILAVVVLPVAIYVWKQLKVPLRDERAIKPTEANISLKKRLLKLSVFALVLVGAFQAWAQSNVTTFLPKYLSDLGYSASFYGLLTSLFMAGSAVGNVVGAHLSETYGKQRVIAFTLALGTIPLILMGLGGYSDGYYVLVPLSGFLTGMSFSVIVVLSQRIIPAGMGMATGLVLGFTFAMGALGALLTGMLADVVGIPSAFLLSGGITLAGGLLAPFIKEETA